MTWAFKVHETRPPSVSTVTAHVAGSSPLIERITVAAGSERGRERATNGDHYLIAEIGRSFDVLCSSSPAGYDHSIEEPSALLMAVADGINEYAGSEVASALAIDTLARHLSVVVPWLGAAWGNDPDVIEGLRNALTGCQARLVALAADEGYDIRLGTTLTAAYVTWPVAHILHVGDSRCYLWRRGELNRLTRDQTVAQKLLDAGAMDERTLRGSRLWTTLTSFIGGTGDLDLEVLPAVLEPGDILMLCTDGFYSSVEDKEILRVLQKLRSSDPLGLAVEKLIDRAKHEGSDDATIAMARFG